MSFALMSHDLGDTAYYPKAGDFIKVTDMQQMITHNPEGARIPRNTVGPVIDVHSLFGLNTVLGYGAYLFFTKLMLTCSIMITPESDALSSH
jgi:hypothetical protein